jgi:hypothetical protein
MVLPPVRVAVAGAGEGRKERRMNALKKLVDRCNEMDMTEQDQWLGDVFMPSLAAAELERLQAIASAFFKIVSPDGFHQCGFTEECPECGESETHADGCKLAAALAPSPCGSASAS